MYPGFQPTFVRPFAIAAGLAFATILPSRAMPVISEFLAANRDDLTDEDGDSSDWIEIHNPGDTTVDLSGFALSDDPDLQENWSFPANTHLVADGRLLVFASGKDRTLGNELHTTFALASSGGSLTLLDTNGVIVSRFENYPAQRSDISYGVGVDSQTGFFSNPTPGEVNGVAASGFAPPVRFSAPRGFYGEPLEVVLSSVHPDAIIHFTTDGSAPSSENGTRYSGPISVGSTTVIRAIASGGDLIPGAVSSQTYLFAGDIVEQSKMHPEITQSDVYRDELFAALEALPVVSLSFENESVFGPQGIYQNPTQRGRSSEREIHFEYFVPGQHDESAEAPAGMRIHGANSRLHPKKPLRIFFRSDYGESRLEHDVFPRSPVKSFKRLLLRGSGHDAWTFDANWTEATFIRNQFLHQSQQAMGHHSPSGRHVNVFLNGQYWGMYELQEFPHEHYNADHHGGEPEDWDVVKHGQEVEAGERDAWDALIALARAGIKTTADYEAIQEYLDLENFADAMIQRIWASDEDWLSPYYLGNEEVDSFAADKNWYVARRSRNETSKFFFYNWDAEMSMGVPFRAEQTFALDFSRIRNSGSPGEIYDALRRFPEFQSYFGDRLQRHFFDGGAMALPCLEERWDQLVGLVHLPVVAESARWGTEVWRPENRESPFTRNDHWLPATRWVRDVFLPNRNETVLHQFRQVGLFPDVPAPRILPTGRFFSNPVEVTLTQGDQPGTMYYTTDGSDPRVPGAINAQSLIAEDSPVRVLVPTDGINSQLGDSWKDLAEPSNLDSWTVGLNGVGFDDGAGYSEFINTPLETMQGVNGSAYLRYQFEIPDQVTLEKIQGLLFRLRYDDGFGAYLNGTFVASDNFGGSFWSSTALSSRSNQDAIIFREFDLSIHTGLLRVGTNVLAIHGQNSTVQDSDFLIEAILEASIETRPDVSPNAMVYDGPFEISGSQVVMARQLSPAGQWSPLVERYLSIACPASSSNLTVTELHYHPSPPSTPAELAASNDQDDFEFLELFNRSEETIDLTGCYFDRGLGFTFAPGALIPPRERRIIVSDPAAFRARYGNATEAVVIGRFTNDSNLANSGETLSLRDPQGRSIFSIRYDDSPPWPTAPDGDGPSLVLVSADTAGPGANLPSSWRPSNAPHGSPGTPGNSSYHDWLENRYGRTTGPGTLPDDFFPGENESNLVLYATGIDLAKRGIEISPEGSFTYQVRSFRPGVSVAAETSDNLEDWFPALEIAQSHRPDGTTLISARPEELLASGRPFFIRISTLITQ